MFLYDNCRLHIYLVNIENVGKKDSKKLVKLYVKLEIYSHFYLNFKNIQNN